MKIQSSRGKGSSGGVLVDVMAGLVLSAMLVAMTGSLWLAGSRDLAATAKYTEEHGKIRNAFHPRLRTIRPAAQAPSQESAKQSGLTHAAAGTQIACTWTATPRTLDCQKTGQPD